MVEQWGRVTPDAVCARVWVVLALVWIGLVWVRLDLAERPYDDTRGQTNP